MWGYDWQKGQKQGYRNENCLSLLLLRSNPFHIMYLDDSVLLQCRIGLISEISTVNPIPLFLSLFVNSFISFIPKGFWPYWHYLALFYHSQYTSTCRSAPTGNTFINFTVYCNSKIHINIISMGASPKNISKIITQHANTCNRIINNKMEFS